MKYKNGDTVCVGDVIRWKSWDNDDFITWTFTGIMLTTGVLYLGGGIDFGRGIGRLISCEDVISESENNDVCDAGIEKVGVVADLYRHISKFNT